MEQAVGHEQIMGLVAGETDAFLEHDRRAQVKGHEGAEEQETELFPGGQPGDGGEKRGPRFGGPPPPVQERDGLEIDDEGHGRTEEQSRPDGDVRDPYVADQRDRGEGGRGEREEGPGVPPKDFPEGRCRKMRDDPRVQHLEGKERQADDRRRGQNGRNPRPEGVLEDRVPGDLGQEPGVNGQPGRGEGGGGTGPEGVLFRIHDCGSENPEGRIYVYFKWMDFATGRRRTSRWQKER